MRSNGDVPRLSTHNDTTTRPEPGADRPFPSCDLTPPLLDAEAVRFLTEEQLAEVLDAAKASRLQRCPGWPRRRREGPDLWAAES